jgi:hypothetical protein
MNEHLNERVVLAHTLYANPSNPTIGNVKPIAEIVDGKLAPITPSTFCPTMRVFITSHYEELERRYPDLQLFLLPDYVPTSATLSKVFLEQGFALMTATASLGSIATRSLRRLNRYCTSAR